MKKMAILLSTDNMNKIEIYRTFLSKNRKAAWRIKRKYTENWLNQINYPINLYFFHKNFIKYRAICKKIEIGYSWPLSEVPTEFHNDKTPYITNIILYSVNEINPEIHISKFPKYDNSNEYFEHGQLGILKVNEIFDLDKQVIRW